MRGTYFPGDFIFSALIVGGGTKTAWRMWSLIDAFQPAIKGKIEIVPCLLAVGNDV